jgi:hypothetical protein
VIWSRKAGRGWALACALGFAAGTAAQCPPAVPVQGAPPPAPLPVFPADNWWNADISTAPVDGSSASFIAYINNGGTRRLHPDFGGEESPGSVAIYGMPYAVVDGAQPKQAVTFAYWDESDGVNMATGQGVPFYPIPAEAITQPHWVEGGAPASIDQRAQSDRHLLMVDCTNWHLYELYNVWYDAAQARWHAGSGAFFDMTRNDRRPDGWTSADAAGLAIFPGLVRYDEVFDPALPDIGHAFRVTVRATNGYVYPASHRAGSTAGALPMGARLRLKADVAGQDPALRTSNPNVRKIFRAMQKHGLIVADNGSDLYITGTFDTRWDNGVLNPAFRLLSASDFEVIELGWKPPAPSPPTLTAVAVDRPLLTGGSPAVGTVTLAAPAPAGGAVVALSAASGAVLVPSSVTVAQGASAATFAVSTSPVAILTASTLSATYAGVTRTATLTLTPRVQHTAATLSLVLAPPVGGRQVVATVTLSEPAPAPGATVTLSSSAPDLAPVPASVTIPAGAVAATFAIATTAQTKPASIVITARYHGLTRSATMGGRARSAGYR